MNKNFNKVKLGLTMLAMGGAFGIVSVAMIEKVKEVIAEENGTVIAKENKKLFVDIDGDNKSDRVLDMQYWHDNLAYYEYAQPGDRISYNNRDKRDTVNVDSFRDKVKKINRKSAKEITTWYIMTKHAKIR